MLSAGAFPLLTAEWKTASRLTILSTETHSQKKTKKKHAWHFGHSRVRVWLGEVALSLISVVSCVWWGWKVLAQRKVWRPGRGEKRQLEHFQRPPWTPPTTNTTMPPASAHTKKRPTPHTHTHTRAHKGRLTVIMQLLCMHPRKHAHTHTVFRIYTCSHPCPCH